MEKRYFLKLTAGLIFLAVLSACDKGGICECFDSAGPQSSQTRSVSYFNQILVQDNINVFITTGSPEQVTIEGGRNLISHIAADVNGGVLTLKNENTCDWVRSYKKSVINVYITMPELTTITSSGYGTIQSVGTLTFDSLFLNTENSSGSMNLAINAKYINASYMLGTANLTLSGHSQSLYADFWEGTGSFNGTNLLTKNILIISNTTGDCYVNSDSLLHVQIFGVGNVYYTGSPIVKYTSEGGTGQLIKNL